MRRRLALLAMVLTTSCAPIVWKAPDRCLSCKASDNPFTVNPYRGWEMRRWQWQLGFAAASLAIAEAVARLGMPRHPANVGTSLTLGLVPHVLQRPATIDGADWAADLWIRSTPIAREHGWKGAFVWTAGYAFLAPYASP
jgi:hypothetical protein